MLGMEQGLTMNKAGYLTTVPSLWPLDLENELQKHLRAVVSFPAPNPRAGRSSNVCA